MKFQYCQSVEAKCCHGRSDPLFYSSHYRKCSLSKFLSLETSHVILNSLFLTLCVLSFLFEDKDIFFIISTTVERYLPSFKIYR